MVKPLLELLFLLLMWEDWECCLLKMLHCELPAILHRYGGTSPDRCRRTIQVSPISGDSVVLTEACCLRPNIVARSVVPDKALRQLYP